MKKFYITFASLIFLASCGGGGGGGGGGGDSTPVTPAPNVSLTAESNSVIVGNSTNLTWSSTNASSCSADWTSATTTSGTEAVTITEPGNKSFSITCSGAGGSGSASVTIEGYRNTDGVVVDGYISGADIFIDENDNWSADATENSTTSDNDGTFTIKYTNGNLVSLGGTDLDSQTLLDNLLITHKLSGHSDFKAVTPVTSVAAFMEDSSLINIVLGIDSSIDIFTFDPVANKGDGGINDYLYEKGNQLTILAYALQNITNNLNTTTETTQDYFKAITEEIEKEYTETTSAVNIESEAFVNKVLDNIVSAKSLTMDETSKSNTIQALSGLMPVIEVKSSNDLTTAVIRFGISTLQTDIQAIANGSASAETVNSYTEDILNYIATDQNIDVKDITPNVIAVDDSLTISEDAETVINILANDSYVSTAPITLTIDNPENGSVEVSDNIVTYTPDNHYFGDDSFSYTISQSEKSDSANVSITIESVNDVPSIDVASTISVDENQTAVTTVTTTDADGDDLTLTLTGTDANSFNLSSENVLSFVEAPDYETKTAYSITLSLTDGFETVTKDIDIAINNLNDNPPIFTSSENIEIDENIEVISTITASDADGSSLVFTLIDSDEFSISSDGVLSFVVPADYESKNLYSAKIMVNDGIFSVYQDVVINVQDVNDNPPVIVTTGFSANENQNAIGSISATDADTNTVFVYTISGSDSEFISIEEETGILTFINSPDYETKNSYTININVSDGLNESNKDISIQVDNVLEDIISSTFSISDGTASQAPILNVSLVLDELMGAKKVYVSMIPTQNNDNTCPNSPFDVAMPLVKNNSTDWVLTEELNRTVSDLCDYRLSYYFNFYDIETESAPPTPGIHLQTANKAMRTNNQYSTSYITPLENKVSFTNSDSDNAFDEINGYKHFLYSPSGEYPSVCETTTYNTDSYTSPELAIPTQDCSLAMIYNVSEDSSKIKYEFYMHSVEPIDSAEIIYFGTFKRADYSNGRIDSIEVQMELGEIIDSDTDSKNVKFEFELPIEAAAAEDETSWFMTFQAMGKNHIGSETSLYYTPVYSTIRDTKPPELVSADFSNYSTSSIPQRDFLKIDVKTANEAGDNGVVTSLRDVWIYAQGPTCFGKVFYVRDDLDGKIDPSITDISATIPLLKDELGTYQIESININDWGFAESYYYDNGTDDPNSLIGSTFTAGDGTAPSCPLWLSYESYEVIELDENNSDVGTFTAQGSSADDIVYSVEENDYVFSDRTPKDLVNKLVISPSGQLSYKTPPDYDYDDGEVPFPSNDSGIVKIVATSSLDPSLSRAIYREIVLNNLNDNSPEILTTEYTVDENQTAIGCVSHSDKDINMLTYFSCLDAVEVTDDTETYDGDITFSVSGDNLLIDSNGRLSFENAPDYEENTTYSANVTIYDGANSTSSTITININDLNDNVPIVTSEKSYSVKENQSSGGSIQIYDPDTVNVFSYTIDGTYEDGALFSINSNGELSFVSNPDYESKNSYMVRIVISDGVNEITEDFAISLLDVVAEAIPTGADLTLLPQDSNTTTVQLLSYVIDGRTATFSIETGPTYGTADLDTTTGQITYTTTYSDVAVEKITFRVNDGVVDDGVADLTLNLNTDPLYKHQWYLDNTGQSAFASTSGTAGEDLNTDVTITNGYTGKNVGVNVIDEGLEIAHADLVANIKEGYSWDCEYSDTDPTNPYPYGDHGTSVAGIIAAKGWNNIGGRGVAPDADLIGYNYLNYQSSTCQGWAWGYNDAYAATMDIFNMSYGSSNYNSDGTFEFPVQNVLSEFFTAAITNGVNNLREGKGGIYIKSLGNSFGSNSTNGFGCGESGVDDEGALGCSIRFHDRLHTTPYIMGVGALKATGIKSSYSSTDPSIWVSGPAGEYGRDEEYQGGLVDRAYEPAMITTDQSGCEAGYVSYYYYPRNAFNDCWDYIDGPHPENILGDYTSTFNGTSSAAPAVAGGVAVLLEAYPSLTWRDVKHVIANSARRNDPDRSYSRGGLLQYDWITNAAGYDFHYWYGFGAYDLGAAMEFSSTYTPDSLGTFTEYGWEESEPIQTIQVYVEGDEYGSGDVYVIDGEQKKTLTLEVGTTYSFNHPVAHPFRFSTTNDGIHRGGVEYTEGVTKSSGVTSIAITENTPTTLYYYCSVHSGMGSAASINDSGSGSEEGNLNLLIPSLSSVENSISYSKETSGDFVEFIQIKIYLDKDVPRDIGMHLISPQGTEMSILHPFSNVAGNPEGQWFIMGVSGFYGEKINGDWTLKVTDYTDNDDEGTLIDWGINIYGH